MGRVRRYKKIKAIDPFSKRAKKKDAREHNLPPDMLNHVAQRQESREKARQAAATLQSKPGASKGRGHLKVKAKRKLPQWAKDELKEEARLDRLAATGEMDPSAPQRGDAGESSSAPKKIAMSVTPKVDDETMKQFKKRVREASLKVLKDENRSKSTTVAKRKDFFAEKSKRRKLQRTGKLQEYLREKELEGMHLDHGQKDDFETTETVRFGETAEAPPRLSALPKRKDKLETKPWLRANAKRERSSCSDREMESMRESVANAYKELKERRRNGQTQFAAHAL